MFDEIARQIGWIVIGAGIFYVVGKAIISHGDAEDRKKELILATWDHQRRLAFRNIWRTSKSDRAIEKVKMQYSPWALLEIELDDKEYDSKRRLSSDSQAYCAALKKIEEEGLPYIFENGEIVATFTNEYKNKSVTPKDVP